MGELGRPVQEREDRTQEVRQPLSMTRECEKQDFRIVKTTTELVPFVFKEITDDTCRNTAQPFQWSTCD